MDRIKESFDSLPIAACFFDKNGVVRLINRRMLAIANRLQKGGIQSLAEMQSALHSPPANVCCLDLRLRIYRFPDGKALRFAQEQITTKAGVRYTQITAADVTELIRKQNQLKAENAKLAEANERLRLLLVQMPEIIREEETLAMKLRVHDDIGHSILAARRVLLQQTDLKEIRVNAALWEQSISVLFRSSQITAQSEPLEAAKKRAEELGVRVLLTGSEPQRQWIRTLSALAICECAANCVRHADGTELYVRFSAEAGLHGGRPDQQRCGAEGKDHRRRRPFHAASTYRRSRRKNGGLEHPSLYADNQSAGTGRSST